MKKLNNKQQFVINFSASIIAYGVSLLISFFLSPYIVRTIGVEANGFIGLANNFVSYASLITLALNSLASRFITISIVKQDIEEASRYFSSVFYSNLFIAGVLFVIGSIIVFFLDRIINIPSTLVFDVRLLFICLFLNCLVSIAGTVFSIATFVRNKLYLESLRNIEANLARALIIVGLFAVLRPRVSYVGLAALVSGIYVLACNLYYTKKLLPEIEICKRFFDMKVVVKLTANGIWNTVNRLGQIFINDLDLLVTNLFIGATQMGILSLAQTVPNLIGGLMSSVVGIFAPNFTILYAKGNKKELLQTIKNAMHIMGIITDIPIIVLIVCGKDFFLLWQPTQDANTLHLLTILAVMMWIVSGSMNCIYQVFTVVNKIKMNAIVTLVSGAVTIIGVFLCLRYTEWGIFAVAGMSSIISIFRNLVFTVPYGAYCLEEKLTTFYPVIIKSLIFTIIALVLASIFSKPFYISSWGGFILKVIYICCICCIVAFFIFFNKAEKKIVLNKLSLLYRKLSKESKFMKIKRKLIYLYELIFDFFIRLKREYKYYLFYKKMHFNLHIMNSKKTINYIIQKRCSVARFGDGEFDIIAGVRDLKFQTYSKRLGEQLRNVLSTNNPSLLICIPRSFKSIRGTNWHAAMYWSNWAIEQANLKPIVDLLNQTVGNNYYFGNAQITRPYIDWQKSYHAKKIFHIIKKIWKDRDLLIVEGKQTRLGVGNDLFDNARSIKRILCPAVNAFDKYSYIKDEVLKFTQKDTLIILALGPTATILASDLSLKGVQALDLGHIDIEYEWYLAKATSKTIIPGKYVNEVVGGQEPEICNDSQYLKEILTVIE